jgi:hypothetical protein
VTTRAPARLIAAELFQQFVQEPSVDLPDGAPAHCEDRAALSDELRLYRFASVLMAVLDAEHRDQSFSAVRDELERLFFPPRAADGRALLVFVRKAMSELAELIQPQDDPQPMSWARRWFQRAGAHESNPATLMMFALRWLDHFAAVAGALREFTPVT